MPRTMAKERMILISVHLPKQMLAELDELIAQGYFPSRSEAIRIAVRDLIMRTREKREEAREGASPEFIPGR